jgi:membrane protein implicated in regulation of membrane protease activity
LTLRLAPDDEVVSQVPWCMTALFLVCFIGGLLLAVRVMIYGVERPREANPSGERSLRLSPALIVAFSVVFGATGYALTSSSIGSPSSRIATAAALGMVAAVVAARLVRRWWTVIPEHDVDDERYVLQGHLARVTKSIRAGVEGEVSFDLANDHRVLRARGIDDGMLAVGTDVVIERIEDDLAYVESWTEVEKRL